MKHLLALLGLITLCACAHVRQGDLDSWRGVPVIELERHPIFSTMQIEKRKLSDGSEIWNFRNGGLMEGRGACMPMGNTVICKDNSREVVCMNQFIVKDGVVREYRAIGDCYTDCRARPASRPCN